VTYSTRHVPAFTVNVHRYVFGELLDVVLSQTGRFAVRDKPGDQLLLGYDDIRHYRTVENSCKGSIFEVWTRHGKPGRKIPLLRDENAVRIPIDNVGIETVSHGPVEETVADGRHLHWALIRIFGGFHLVKDESLMRESIRWKI